MAQMVVQSHPSLSFSSSSSSHAKYTIGGLPLGVDSAYGHHEYLPNLTHTNTFTTTEKGCGSWTAGLPFSLHLKLCKQLVLMINWFLFLRDLAKAQKCGCEFVNVVCSHPAFHWKTLDFMPKVDPLYGFTHYGHFTRESNQPKPNTIIFIYGNSRWMGTWLKRFCFALYNIKMQSLISPICFWYWVPKSPSFQVFVI